MSELDDILKDAVDNILKRNPAGCIELVEKVYDYGYDVRLFYKNLLEYLRNLTVLKVINEPGQLIDLPEGEVAELKRLSDGFSQEELQQLFVILSRGEDELKRSSSPRLSLEMTLIRMATLRPLVPIAELIERVKGLEEGKVRAYGNTSVQKSEARSQKTDPNLEREQYKEDVVEKEEVASHIEMEEPEETWKGFLRFVQKKRPPLASKLEHGKLIELNESEIKIGFIKTIYLDMISKDDIKAVEEMLSGYLSRNVRVTAIPVIQENKVREPVKREQPRQPIIEEALKVFGGRIIEEGRA